MKRIRDRFSEYSSSALFLCFLLLAATTLVYLNSFPGAFHFDDFALLLENPHVNSESFRYASFLDQYGGRPLTLWTFYWNYHLFGKDPFSYHLLSFLLHALVVVMIFLFFRQMFGGRFLAFTTALIFAVHPIQTQPVNYIWSRSVLLMACFGLAAMLIVKKRPLTALFLFQLAIWSRTEAVALTPFLIMLNGPSWKRFTALALVNVLGFAYSLTSYSPAQLGWNYPGLGAYWMAQSVAFWKYLHLMFWPASLNLDHDFPLPGVLIVLLAAISTLTLCSCAFTLRRKHPIPAFGVFWVVTVLAPSWIIPNSDWFNESRTYLAVAGFALIVSHLLSWIPRRQWAAIPLIGLLALITTQRNELWRDDLALWEDAASKSPEKGRARYNLGAALARQGDLRKAEQEFRVSGNLDPGDDLSYSALAYCAEMRQAWEGASQLYSRALRLNPNNGYARQGLARMEKRSLAVRGESRAESRAGDLRWLARHEEESMPKHRR